MSDNEKRSSDDLIPGPIDERQGVGGRHRESTRPQEGGGYPDICSISGSDFTARIRKTDPRLQELRDMGIGETWLEIAELIGFESFVVMWMHLGGETSVRIRIPPYSKYLKFLRNELIRQLSRDGETVHNIRRRVRSDLREDVSERHIARIISGDKIRQ